MVNTLLEEIIRLKVVERFLSFQGEGILTGIPMFFIRFPFCNLQCKWCDTKYALKDEGKKVSEIELVREFITTRAKWVCLTGGEPLLYNLDLLVMTLPVDAKINIQTNGTLTPPSSTLRRTNFWSISPKLTSSGNADAIKYDILEKLLRYGASELKFVLACHKDFIEIKDILEELRSRKVDIKRVPVIFQPNGNRLDDLGFLQRMWGRTKEFAVLNPDYDIRFILQQHRVVWENKRGI